MDLLLLVRAHVSMCPFSLLPLSSGPMAATALKRGGVVHPQWGGVTTLHPCGRRWQHPLRVSRAFINKPSAVGLPTTTGGKGAGADCLEASFRKSKDMAGKGSQEHQSPRPPPGPLGSRPAQVCVRNRLQVCTGSRSPSSAGRGPPLKRFHGPLPCAPGGQPPPELIASNGCVRTIVNPETALCPQVEI